MKPVIHTLWIGSKLSIVEQTCLASFVHHGHDVKLYSYGDVGNVPDGVSLIDANTVVSSSEIYTYPNGSYAAFADLFRWEVLRQKGGCWVDTDVICLKPFDFEHQHIFGWQDSSVINIAVSGLPKGSEHASMLAEMCRHPNKIQPFDKIGHKLLKSYRRYFRGDRPGNIGWGEGGGVKGFTKYAKYTHLDNYAQNFLAFYPIHAKCWKAFVDGSVRMDSSILADSYAVHLWNENLRKIGLNKNTQLPDGSFIKQAADYYL